MFDGESPTVYQNAGPSTLFPIFGASQHGSHGTHGSHGHMNGGTTSAASFHAGHESHHGHKDVSHRDHGDHADHGDHRDHGGHEGGGHMMSNFFHTGETETILFKFWRTESAWALTLSFILIFLVAVLYEGLKFYREWLFERSRRRLDGGRDQYGPPRGYGEPNYNKPTYSYRMPPPPQQQPQVQTQIYAYRPPSSSIPPYQPNEATSPGSVQPSHLMPRQPPHEAGIQHIQQVDPEAAVAVPWRRRWCSRLHLCQTLLHVLQVFVSFLLMLVFMTFNVWLCVAVLLGAGVGYYIFCAFSTRINEHCN